MNPSVLVLTFVAVTAALLVCFKLLSLLYISRHRRKSIPVQQYLSGTLELGPSDLCFPVRYASADFFQNLITFLPWEAEGAFVLNDTHFTYVGRSLRLGSTQHKQFPREQCLVEYVEARKMRDGGLSWFSLEAEDGQKHYFCTQSKIPDLTTEFGTTALYEKMTEQYSNL